MSPLLLLITAPLLAAVISTIRHARGFTGSDHYVHLAFATLIRRNRHRFIVERPYALFGREMGYPQLMHWMLSFLPEPVMARTGPWMTAGFMSATILLSECFALLLLDAWHDHGMMSVVGCAALVLATTPYYFDPVDPRSRGLSGRAFGLFFGSLYTWALLLHAAGGGVLWLAVAGVAALLVFLGSTFAWQFALFATPLLAAGYGKPWLLAPPVGALLLAFLLFPSTTTVMLHREIQRKRHWIRYMAPLMILNERFSVWRDFVHDFWVRGRDLFRRRHPSSAADFFGYVYYNPMIRMVTGFPVMAVLAISLATHRPSISWPAADPVTLLTATAAVGVLLVITTSFRRLIFLGRPERYMEFVIGPAALALMLMSPNPVAVCIGLVTLHLLTLMLEYVAFGRLQRNAKENRQRDLDAIRAEVERLEKEQTPRLRIMSNSIQVARHLISADRQLMVGNEIGDFVGSLPLMQAFRTAEYFRADAMPILIREFSIDTLVWDTRDREAPAPPTIPEMVLHPRATCGSLRLYTLAPARSY